MQLIQNRYEKIIKQILQNHENTIKSLQKETIELQNDTKMQITDEYINKITEIEKDFNNEINSLNLLFNNLQNETKKLIQTFTQFQSIKLPEIDLMMSDFTRTTTNQFSKLQNQIKEIKNNYLAELKTIDNESEMKLQKLQNESQENLKKITDQHLNELSEIQKESFIEIGIDPSIVAQIQLQRNQIFQLKENFQKYFNCFHKNLFEYRSKFKELMNLYSLDLTAYEKAKNGLETKLNQMIQEMQNEKNHLKSKVDQISIQFEKELNEKQNELVILIQQLNNEFVEKSNSLQNDFYSKSSSISELILQLTKERDEVISNYETERKIKTETKIKNLININQQENDQFISLKKKLEDSYQKLKENHFSEKASNLSLHQEMTENEINRFSEEMMKIRKSIQMISNSENINILQSKQTLSNLQNEKEEFESNFKEKVAKFNEETNKEIEKLNKNQFNEIESLTNEQTVKFNSFLAENEQLIKNNEDEYLKKKELIQSQYEKERSELFNQIQIEFLRKNEIEMAEIDQKFSSLYEKQSLLLSQIEPPSSSILFSQLTNEANDLSIKRAEMSRMISIQRNQLNQSFENEINNENLRHSDFLNELKNSGRKINGRDTLRQSLRMQINDIKKEKNEENEKFQHLLDELKNQHIQRLDQLSLELNNEINLMESAENELKSKFSEENLNCDNKIEFALKSFNEDQISFQNEIVLLQKDYEKKINDLIESKENSIKQFEAQLNELNNKFDQVKINEIEEKEKEQKEFDLNFSSLKQKHNKTVIEMKDFISESSASIARLLIQNRNELEKNLNVNKENLSKFLSKSEKEKVELIQNNKSLDEFYNEKIDVLTKRKEEAKDRFINRPSREIEIEKIKKYEKYCKRLTKILKSGLNDISNYRRINAIKEKEYNKMFGRNPAVGVLIVGSSINNNFQYY